MKSFILLFLVIFALNPNAAQGCWAPQQRIGGVGSSTGPSVAVFQNRLYAAWKGVDNDQGIYWSSFDGRGWAPQQRIGGVGSSTGPSVAVFQNRLYAAWKGVNNDQGIYWSSFDGTNWAPQQNIRGVGSSTGPSITVFQNRLYAAWKGVNNDQGIYWSSFDGTNWAPQQNIRGVGSSTGPSITVFQNRLYASWKGVNNDQGIYWSSFDGGNWAGQQNIRGVGSSVGPSIAVFQNRLFASWKGVNNDQGIYWSSFDGTNWAQQLRAAGVGSSIGPSVTVFQNRFYAAWKGVANDQGIYWSSFDRCPVPNGTVHEITVNRHNVATINDGDVDRILADGTGLLQANDGAGDVACATTFIRSGGTGAFNTGNGSITTQAELTAVFRAAGRVKVVRAVDFCAGRFNVSFAGCGQTPGNSFIVERFTAAQEGIIWAHEFGHNQGLPDLTASPNSVMNGQSSATGRRVTQAECNSYRAAARAFESEAAAQPEVDSANIPVADAPKPRRDTVFREMPHDWDSNSIFAPSPDNSPIRRASDNATGRLPVDQFVSRLYFHGLPLDEAATYGEENVDALVAILSDPGRVMYHQNAAITLGMIGSDRAARPLIAYIQNASSAPQASEDEAAAELPQKGRVAAVIGLGYLVNRSGSQRALNFLIQNASPEAVSAAMASDELSPPQELTRYTLLSLGLSGNADAAQHLQTLAQGPSANNTATLSAVAINEALSEGLKLNAQVSQSGIVEYYKRIPR